jgi:hypothetical protein
MRLSYAVFISFTAAAAASAVIDRTTVTVVKEAPYETAGDVMSCDSLDESTRVAKLSQTLSEVAGAAMLDVNGAMDTVNSETGQHSCDYGQLRYGTVREVNRIIGDSGMVLFRVFKFSNVTSFKRSSDDNAEHDWAPMTGGPVDQYVVVPSYGSVI